MKQIVKIFIPTFGSFRNVAKEAKNTSISRERFIDFIKVIGLLMITFNTEYLLDFKNSAGELLVYNESFTSSNKTRFTWFTTGISLFFFSFVFVFTLSLGRETLILRTTIGRSNSAKRLRYSLNEFVFPEKVI